MMETRQLHDYQLACVQKILDTPYIALFLDMGLGKTVTTLTAIRELKLNRLEISRVLVIAPLKVAEATWVREISLWSHLQVLKVSEVLGTAAQRRRALQVDADIYVTNRDNVKWLVDEVGVDEWPFDMVVLDESSSFKNHKAIRFKALKMVRPRIKRIVELTGTPAPHGLLDLWAQIFLLDAGARLGRTLSVYRDLYFLPDKRNAVQVWTWKLRPGAAEAIQASISDICVSMSAADYLTLPDCVYDTVPVKLDSKAAAAYKTLERDMLLQVSEEEWVSAGTAGILTTKLLQLCNGAVYDEEHSVRVIHDCKLAAFGEVLEQLGGEHCLVFYNFQHDRDRLAALLSKRGLHYRVYAGAQDEVDWNDGKIEVLLAHPASCAYGLNLQRGGHHIIWFGLTWSLEQYQQANKRLHRQGQSCPVIIHHLVVQDGVDEDVMRALSSKDAVQHALLEALKARRDKYDA